MIEQHDEKTKGWWFSVLFMVLILGLIVFLSFFQIVDSNRELLIGALGILTGQIPSMLTIASGRSPEEINELKDKLSQANADRVALISRLRDAQIQLQMKSDQLFEIQNALIEKLSIFAGGEKLVKTKDDKDVVLDKNIENWMPKVSKEEKEND
jgi:hypothetical protein